jgi:PAS domain S-box-containing protein
MSWNQGAERLFGYPAEEMVGMPITILIPPDRQNEERMILEKIAGGERVDHYETVRRRKDGGSVAISLTVSPVKNAEGRIIGASKIARDITERKQAEARENALTTQLGPDESHGDSRRVVGFDCPRSEPADCRSNVDDERGLALAFHGRARHSKDP